MKRRSIHGLLIATLLSGLVTDAAHARPVLTPQPPVSHEALSVGALCFAPLAHGLFTHLPSLSHWLPHPPSSSTLLSMILTLGGVVGAAIVSPNDDREHREKMLDAIRAFVRKENAERPLRAFSALEIKKRLALPKARIVIDAYMGLLGDEFEIQERRGSNARRVRLKPASPDEIGRLDPALLKIGDVLRLKARGTFVVYLGPVEPLPPYTEFRVRSIHINMVWNVAANDLAGVVVDIASLPEAMREKCVVRMSDFAKAPVRYQKKSESASPTEPPFITTEELRDVLTREKVPQDAVERIVHILSTQWPKTAEALIAACQKATPFGFRNWMGEVIKHYMETGTTTRDPSRENA